ncbi:hypothetical protein [Aquimarina algiphila]|uniref:hypothetical protein n=1 Tax=Aquimarina algiphila TaxID=2047982 RepID=UPI00232D275D|nr:hypothetical protein [Aquimarina algiphila]
MACEADSVNDEVGIEFKSEDDERVTDPVGKIEDDERVTDPVSKSEDDEGSTGPVGASDN